MPWIEVEGSKVHYMTRPGGPCPIIFLHGGFGSSSELWSDTMAALPSEWTGYAIDNFLRSDPPPRGYNVAAFARRAAGFAEVLCLDRAVFAGHSMGGVVCQLVALSYPDRVAGVVLTCTGAHMTNHELGHRLLAELRDSGGASTAIRDISANWFRTTPQAFFDDYVARAASAPLQAMIDVQASLIATDLRSRLAEITAPALVVFGTYDTGRTIDHAETLVRGIPRSRLVVMNDSGHSPMVETPHDFNAALHDFLATLEPAIA
jgi:3-oxoadipate enol-lactonase